MNVVYFSLQGQELCASVPVDIDTISQAIDLLDRELNELQQQIQNGTFKPLHNEILNSSNQFTSLCHQLKTHLCQLLDAFTRVKTPVSFSLQFSNVRFSLVFLERRKIRRNIDSNNLFDCS